MMARGRAALVARLRRKLGDREIEVLRSVHRLKLLSTDQIRRLHFADLSENTQGRRCRELLRRLTKERLVVSPRRHIGGVKSGSSGYLFSLTGLGWAVIDPSPSQRQRRSTWEARPYFQDHQLAVSELGVQLQQICRSGEADLIRFEAEPAAWRHFAGIGGETVVLKPDAFVRIGVGDFELAWFVEVDLGTESLPTTRRKCQLYCRYYRSGQEQQHSGVFPRVIWLVPDQRRQQGIASVLRGLPPDARHLFTVALTDQAAEHLAQLPEMEAHDE